ncbi:hypothetical protein COTS27_00897 [Spirochaetota bacterium]|nr:hypothetical protein COTS27_00897 [Spirochaetota bacterium]
MMLSLLYHIPFSSRMRTYYRYVRKLFSRALNEPLPPHNIAMGFALGLAFGLGPTFGFQIIPYLIVALKFGYSKIAGILLIFVTNPITLVPIYVFELIVGDILLGNWIDIDIAAFREALAQSITAFSFSDLIALGRDTIIAFVIGSLFCAIVAGTATYFLSYVIIVRWKNRRRRKVGWWTKRRALKRQKLKKNLSSLNNKVSTKGDLPQ